MSNQIIPKLTLYDFFAMLVPGSLIEVELYSIIANQQLSDVLSHLNLGIIQIAVATIIAYLLGLLAAKIMDCLYYVLSCPYIFLMELSYCIFKKKNVRHAIRNSITPNKESFYNAYYKIMELDRTHATSLGTIKTQERQFAMLRTMIVPILMILFMSICCCHKDEYLNGWCILFLLLIDVLAMLYTQFRIYMCVWEDNAYLKDIKTN